MSEQDKPEPSMRERVAEFVGDPSVASDVSSKVEDGRDALCELLVRIDRPTQVLIQLGIDAVDVAVAEIERLRAQVAELLPWAEAQAMAIVEIAVGDRHFAAADLLGRIAADEFETPEEWAKRVVDEWHNYTKNGIDEPPAGE